MTESKNPDQLNYTLVKVGETQQELRAAAIALFETLHGRKSTTEELQELDAKLDEDFSSKTDKT